MKAKLIRRDVLSVIKLGNSSFSRDRIQGNKRGKKNKLTIKETSSFEEFWNTLLIPNLKNKHNGIELGFKLKNTYFQKITTNNNYYGKSVSGNKICSDGQGVISESSETGAYACLSTSYPIDFDFRVRTY